MPVIEIASVKSDGLNLNPDSFSVAILEENVLRSHRRRFCDFLKKTSGTIIHVGNPEFKKREDGIFCADEIIDWDFEAVEILYVPIAVGVNADFEGGKNQQIRFKFLNDFKRDIDRLLRVAVEKSPIEKCYFFTDFYFGPDKERLEVVKSIHDLWKRHDMEGLVFNTMYELGQI